MILLALYFFQAKFLHSQRELEEEFAVTEVVKPIGRKPLQELCPSQCPQAAYEDESSFMPFHDSMQASSSFRKPCDKSSGFASGHESIKANGRNPLQDSQELNPLQASFGAYEGTFDESSFLPYHDSMQASSSFRNPCKPDGRKPLQVLNPPQSSFGVYEGTFDESSFMPYHDSMHASTCENPGTNHREYAAPLGVPIVHYDQAICEQTFTQFDIAHPKSTDSISTPRTVSQHRGMFGLLCGFCTVQHRQDWYFPVFNILFGYGSGLRGYASLYNAYVKHLHSGE